MTTKTNNSTARDAGQTAISRLNAYATRKAKMDNALDACGIGHNFGEILSKQSDEISEFCAKLQSSMMRQAVYNLTNNVPCGVLTHSEASATHAIKRGIVSACGSLVKWDITQALELAADIAEDVNAHGEAKAIRAMAYTEAQ